MGIRGGGASAHPILREEGKRGQKEGRGRGDSGPERENLGVLREREKMPREIEDAIQPDVEKKGGAKKTKKHGA